MFEEHNKRFRFTFRFQYIHPERESGPSPTRRPIEREIIDDFLPRRQPKRERERGLASFPRGATKRERIVLSSTSHGERRFRFVWRATERGIIAGKSRSHGGRENRLLGKEDGEVSRERENRTKANRRRSSSLLSFCLHVSSNTVSSLPKISDASYFYLCFWFIFNAQFR